MRGRSNDIDGQTAPRSRRLQQRSQSASRSLRRTNTNLKVEVPGCLLRGQGWSSYYVYEVRVSVLGHVAVTCTRRGGIEIQTAVTKFTAHTCTLFNHSYHEETQKIWSDFKEAFLISLSATLRNNSRIHFTGLT